MIIGVVCSRLDKASSNMAECLIRDYAFENVNVSEGIEAYANGKMRLFITDLELVRAEIIDSLGLDLACILSKHASQEGIVSFTTHSLGNWNDAAKLGGKPKELSYAAPVAMLSSLAALRTMASQATYEATHHGPLLKTPSLFFEIGGNEQIINSEEIANKAADAAYDAMVNYMNSEVEYSKVVIGIGGTHYPMNFSRLALEKGYAFSHIMPKYALKNADGTYNFEMLEQAMVRTMDVPDLAVIDSKSMNATARTEAVKELDKIGINYEKI